MKALQSLTLSILLLVLPTAALAQPESERTQPVEETGEVQDTGFVYANRVLKRRLQTDRRMGVTPCLDRAVVFAGLPYEDGLHLNLILGRYKAFGSNAGANTNRTSTRKSKQDKNIFETRKQAELLVEGASQADLKVLDEFGAPPTNADEPGEYKELAKFKPQSARLIESFDQALGGDLAAARSSLKEAEKIASRPLITNNLACLEALLGDKEAALKIFKTRSEADFSFPEKLNLAIILLATGKENNGLTVLKELEDSANAPGRLKIDLLAALSKAYLAQKNQDAARKTLQKLLRLYPANSHALLLAANLEYSEGNYNQAIHYLQSISTTLSGPDGAAALIKLSQCYAHLGKFDEALKTANKATSSFPNEVSTHTNLAKLYMDDKEWLGAKLQYERALELNPPFAVKKAIYNNLLHCVEANSDLNSRERQKAMLQYTESWLKANPDQAICHANRAYVLSLEAAGKAAAIKEYEQALKLPGASRTMRYNLALLYAQCARKEDARAQLKLYQANATAKEKALAETLLQSLQP